MIVGGFPCVGFSTMGLRHGFQNAGSGLFKEVLRLADVLACPLLLLENVPNLLNVRYGACGRRACCKAWI
jgi:site-specific DNA-cytosine methylase